MSMRYLGRRDERLYVAYRRGYHYTHRTKAYKRLALGFEEYTCYSTGDIDQRSGEKAVLC